MPSRPQRLVTFPDSTRRAGFDLPRLLRGLGSQLPFSGADVTAGGESELQAVVIGRRESVDLPQTIADSNYFANIVRRTRAGDTSPKLLGELERFLAENREQVWENSWVRFPRRLLAPAAGAVLEHDLLADKGDPAAGQRTDVARFVIQQQGEEQLRIPVSYLLKLGLADAIAADGGLPRPLATCGERLLAHFLSDNTSPETFSFRVLSLVPGPGYGAPLARETARRYLLSQLIVEYANRRFGLTESGQQARIYFAPQTPVRQRELNGLIADGFYRELFMSPCLSGWDQGEKKHRYMELCHQVLSRSQLQAVAKLREAGIITNNLVVLPNVSNTSLANNGTHISLGSRLLSAAVADPASGFGAAEEKYAGDLAIKCIEHFLPLFVGTCSAAPSRMGFSDFHPELALGFLPHELDYTHLRMLWRRWRKKADLAICGRSLTPFGPGWLDQSLSAGFGLRGDFIPDARLIDYPAALLSTWASPALDGRLGNHERLKGDLAALGAFDPQMSLYLLCRQRQFAAMGFSGFEGRHYSLFPDLGADLAAAAALQTLVTTFAYRQMATGRLHHRLVPDDPVTESERRQIFFFAAAGIPTFYVRRSSRNLLLRRILQRTRKVRPSSRYPGYFRVPVLEYQRTLLEMLREEAADLVESLGVGDVLDDFSRRLEEPALHGAAGRLTAGILGTLGAGNPMRVPAREFNLAAERYYREELRRTQLRAALGELAADLVRLTPTLAEPLRRALGELLPQGPGHSWAGFCQEVLDGSASAATLQRLIGLLLLTVAADDSAGATASHDKDDHDLRSSLHRAL
ncbi:hypothetical protein JCM30471_21110 [Desulfuromonas carbonis]|uniref:hypothetical protein n=1 Tax=Desulfuromonas sp. DDH964 TaxID=1823759 RepID=UPI00078C3633|nr:hypothetical protein [Desulfuromonas sp. DDH964]AMV73692.1 hypothetical protein DBW_3394 [Desulfuromonas sp. DDH964]